MCGCNRMYWLCISISDCYCSIHHQQSFVLCLPIVPTQYHDITASFNVGARHSPADVRHTPPSHVARPSASVFNPPLITSHTLPFFFGSITASTPYANTSTVDSVSRSPTRAAAGGAMSSTADRSALDAAKTMPYDVTPRSADGLRLQTTQRRADWNCSSGMYGTRPLTT